MHNNFNIRIYGVLIEENSVLLSDEYIKGNKITKFPGGGLEFGEGTKDCLVREFKEELDLNIEVLDHFYTTDFFVASAFHPNTQIVSIYYVVKSVSKLNYMVSDTPHNYETKEGAQSIRWVKINDLKESDLTLIIDKKVVELLLNKFK